MIIITGGAGFIGSALLWELNLKNIKDIIIVDRFGKETKWKNLVKRSFSQLVHKDNLFTLINNHSIDLSQIEAIFHFGACSSTTESDFDYLLENNINYSMELFRLCTEKKIPFIYASSAATYGAGTQGYGDEESQIPELRPINPYGFSKQIFDCWVLSQQNRPPFWAGLKFFNVFGPQEYHKGPQASVVFHAFPQVKEKNRLKLFKSYHPDFADGEQKRDFIYIKDVTKICAHFLTLRSEITPGIFNVGTGCERTFIDLGTAVFKSFSKVKCAPNFEWIEMPDSVKSQYQYFTKASLEKLRSLAKYKVPFYSLEEGISDYVQNYLMKDDKYL